MLNLAKKCLVIFSILTQLFIYINCGDSEEVGGGLYGLNGRQIAETCNTDKANGPLMPCASGLYCDPAYNICDVPLGGKCSTYITCSGEENTCYNSTCMATASIPKCNTDSKSCPSGTFCESEFRQVCSIRAKKRCNGLYTCESTYACHDGYCKKPQLFDYCLIGIGPSCSKGLYCHPFWLACIVPEGGKCRNSGECGGEYLSVCRNKRCRKPGLHDTCVLASTSAFPGTECAKSACDADTNECRIPFYGECKKSIDCVNGAKCRCERNKPCEVRKCLFQRLGEHCNLDSKVGSVLKCGNGLTCDSKTRKCIISV